MQHVAIAWTWHCECCRFVTVSTVSRGGSTKAHGKSHSAISTYAAPCAHAHGRVYLGMCLHPRYCLSSDLHCLQSFARLIEVQGQKHNELDRMRGREVSATLTLLPAAGSVFPFATAVAHAAHTDGCIATSALDTALR